MKLDLGCGKNKLQGFIGVDCRLFDGVDRYCDLTQVPWVLSEVADYELPPEDMALRRASLKVGEKWKATIDGRPLDDDSVDEIHSSHFLEHLDRLEWIPFMNEAHRVLKVGSQMRIIVPHWSHDCAYGDPTHKSFVSGWAAFYWNKAWRDINAPHSGYTCDFDYVIGGGWEQWLNVRTQEVKEFAMQHYTNSFRDLIFTLTKRPKS